MLPKLPKKVSTNLGAPHTRHGSFHGMDETGAVKEGIHEDIKIFLNEEIRNRFEGYYHMFNRIDSNYENIIFPWFDKNFSNIA